VSNFQQFCPQDLFNGGQSKDGAIQIGTFAVSVGAGATAALVAAVPGKVIKVINLEVMAATADVEYNVKSASNIIMYGSVRHKEDKFFQNSFLGVTRTVAGEALQFTAGAASIINVSGQYITYTP